MSSHGIDLAVVIAVTAAVIAWTLVAERVRRWNITAPITFVAIGLLLANWPLDLISVDLGSEGTRTIAELTLAIVLFADAATVDVGRLRADLGLPSRLLLVGLPITMIAGTLAARLLFPDWSWALCALVGAAVAPTDAALGAAIIDDERVPSRIRRVLNVESGLNDGIATPFVTFFLVAAVAGSSLAQESKVGALLDLAVGAALGVALGAGGALLARRAGRAGWGSESLRGVALAALAALSWALAVEVGANGFVAAFVAGLGHAAVTRGEERETLEFTHHLGAVMSWFVWFVFGASMVPLLTDATWRDAVFAVAALTAVRMLPVALSLTGAGLDRPTVAVLGWFGPRGLASVVFALLTVGVLPGAEARTVVITITATVLLSVIAHGVSAAPVATRYARTHRN
jgi:sodium/hydrogen antiporter